jgi:hypothetical protein
MERIPRRGEKLDIFFAGFASRAGGTAKYPGGFYADPEYPFEGTVPFQEGFIHHIGRRQSRHGLFSSKYSVIHGARRMANIRRRAINFSHNLRGV